MPRQPRKSIRLGQNFLTEPRLVKRLVRLSSIGASDVVYEIGPGKGIITAELARSAQRVIAIEKDPSLVRILRQRFRESTKVEIVQRDFLEFEIESPNSKIFANVPFNLTTSIVRKIVCSRANPREAYLILQKEPARKFAGTSGETLFSLLAKPYFEFRIIAQLRRADFHPRPNVDAVLLRISRRTQPILRDQDASDFRAFVSYGFGRCRQNLRSAFKPIFSYEQWKRVSREIAFPVKATPTELTFDQWLELYFAFKSYEQTRAKWRKR